ncbi:MAG: DUF4365 domain-containing protein [Nostoc sp. EfeVER01]|uniref:DUF4365 domain-containing protein n=1 Tax=unclassified Nostoc TaxID=2593658 RepID=UPI002AD59F16|nr:MULTISPECIES: DUF4365 domain-containing protein [unclassified Nostoc]MDZ7947483.1 DUF4365 domain-containing protein [Nostoc sp. EfeVER01]MDZ7996049.1 DUF4365 domain-containing protein [Nostoc sp. EspVER01]
MSLNTQKEDFSYAYVYAVTATAGYSLQAATRRLDDSGIDTTITVPGKLNSKRLPRFDVQIKSTSQDVKRETSIKYRLSAKNYDELREDDPFVPQLYILITGCRWCDVPKGQALSNEDVFKKDLIDWIKSLDDKDCKDAMRRQAARYGDGAA